MANFVFLTILVKIQIFLLIYKRTFDLVMLIRNRTIHVFPFENFCALLEMFVI